jgi:hypothetical protein
VVFGAVFGSDLDPTFGSALGSALDSAFGSVLGEAAARGLVSVEVRADASLFGAPSGLAATSVLG